MNYFGEYRDDLAQSVMPKPGASLTLWLIERSGDEQRGGSGKFVHS